MTGVRSPSEQHRPPMTPTVRDAALRSIAFLCERTPDLRREVDRAIRAMDDDERVGVK